MPIGKIHPSLVVVNNRFVFQIGGFEDYEFEIYRLDMRNPQKPWKVLTLDTQKPIVDIMTYFDTQNFLELRAKQDLNLKPGEERHSEDDSDFLTRFERQKSAYLRLALPEVEQADHESSSMRTDDSFRIMPESARSDMLPFDASDESNLATHEINRSIVSKHLGNVEQLHRQISLERKLTMEKSSKATA